MAQQKSKIIKDNLKLYKLYKDRIEKDDLDWWNSSFNFMQCVNCGGYTTKGNFRFCNKNPNEVRCFNCQYASEKK